MGRQIGGDGTEVRMAAGLDISCPDPRIAEINSTRIAAHYRTRLVDMRQAQGMAQFVCGYVKQHLANISLAAWPRQVEIDYYGQANHTALICVNLGFTHLMVNVRALGESN